MIDKSADEIFLDHVIEDTIEGKLYWEECDRIGRFKANWPTDEKRKLCLEQHCFGYDFYTYDTLNGHAQDTVWFNCSRRQKKCLSVEIKKQIKEREEHEKVELIKYLLERGNCENR